MSGSGSPGGGRGGGECPASGSGSPDGGEPPAGGPWRAGAAAGALCAVVLLVGCGASVELPDLFVVQRSGSVPGARLTLVVNEGGSVRCDAGPPRPARAARPAVPRPALPGFTRQLSDPQLVQARGLSEELQGPSTKHLSLPPRPGSVFRYNVRDAEGMVRFADNSAGQPSVLHHLAYFVLEVAQKVCGLPE
jgi:hypothetical protein